MHLQAVFRAHGVEHTEVKGWVLVISGWVSRVSDTHTASDRERGLAVSMKLVSKATNSVWTALTISRLVQKFKLSPDLAVTSWWLFHSVLRAWYLWWRYPQLWIYCYLLAIGTSGRDVTWSFFHRDLAAQGGCRVAQTYFSGANSLGNAPSEWRKAFFTLAFLHT